MALKWSEIESSQDFVNSNPVGQNKQRLDFLSKVKPEMSQEAFKLLENKVMLKEQPSNQYGTSQPMPEAPFDIDTGIQASAGGDIVQGIPQIPPPPEGGASGPGIPAVPITDMRDMKWTEVRKSDFYKLNNPQGRQAIADEWLKVQQQFLSNDGFNALSNMVKSSLDEPLPIPSPQHQQVKQAEPGLIKRTLAKASLGLYDPYGPMQVGVQTPATPEAEQAMNAAQFGKKFEPLMASPDEIATAGLEPTDTEKALNIMNPQVRTMEEVQALQEPGFVGSMLNPAEMFAMGGTGAIIAKRFGKPLLATTLDYALNGVPAVAKGMKGFVKGIAGGMRGVESIAASRNVPVSNTIDIMEKPLLDMWESTAVNDAVKSGKYVGTNYIETIPQNIRKTVDAMKKYATENGFSPEEIQVMLKTGDIPPTQPMTVSRLEPYIKDIADEGIQPSLPSMGAARQPGLPLKIGIPEPIVTTGKVPKPPPLPGEPSGLTPDDLNHPYLGNLNPRIARGGLSVKGLLGTAQQYIENPIRMFMKAGGNLKREVYDKIEDADMSSLREFHDRFLPKINEWKKKADSKRLATFMINRQEDGADILKAMGINVNKVLRKMTPDEMSIANQMDDLYREFYHRINVARIKSGLPEMGKVDNYFTFYRQMDWLEANMGINPLDTANIDDVIKRKFIHPKSTFFAEALARTKGSHVPVELDAFQSFGKYAQNSLNHINLSPEISRGRKVVQQLEKTHPELYSDITNWLDFVSGKSDNILPANVRKFLLSTNKRLALSVLSWNFRTMLVQPTALKNTLAEAGVKDTIAGIFDVMLSKKARSFAQKNSNLLGRKFDVAVDDILKLAKGPIQKIGKAGMRPMQELDMLTAEASWNAFMRQGKRMGIEGKDLIRFANDKVILTQASGRKQHLARIQRTDVGRLVSTLQTFVINDWGFLTQDVLGLGKNVPMNKANIGKAYRWIAGTILTNSLFEDGLNIYSPYPTPIKATMEEINKRDATFWSTAEVLGKELLDVAPLIGSAAKYRTGFWGPTFEAGKKLLEGDRRAEQMFKLTGIPLSFLKVPTRLMEGKGIQAALLGEKTKPKKSKNKMIRPMSSGGSIGGKVNKKNKPKIMIKALG